MKFAMNEMRYRILFGLIAISELFGLVSFGSYSYGLIQYVAEIISIAFIIVCAFFALNVLKINKLAEKSALYYAVLAVAFYVYRLIVYVVIGLPRDANAAYVYIPYALAAIAFLVIAAMGFVAAGRSFQEKAK